MLNVATFDVTELQVEECEQVQGGSDFSYAAGYTFYVMVAHPWQATLNALDYYSGK